MRKKVLYVVHNHPAHGPGGSEAYALNVYRGLLGSDEFEPLLLARAEPAPAGEVTHAHTGTPFASINDDPNQFLAFIHDAQYDKFFMRMADKTALARQLAEFLRTHQPDVVHIQHTLFIGVDLVSIIRRTLPDAPIVYTLHEYVPICHHYGQMVRTVGHGLCDHASPRRCHDCFPQHSPQEFFLRERFIKAQLSNVDLFIAPSRFLLERYADWGIPRDRLRFEEHGFPPPMPLDGSEGPHNRFAFFGVLTPFKGIDVLLRAMEQLGPGFEGHLTVYGANYAHQPEEMRNELARLFEATAATVTHVGAYDHNSLPNLMAEIDWVVVPSIWWENSPLVIQEAFQHGRPVICSDIGGMAEKVKHQVSGLYSPVGDDRALAATLADAARLPGLWERLRAGIPPVRTMEDHVAALTGIYNTLLEARNVPGGERAIGAVGR